MSTDITPRNQAQYVYTHALSAAWRNRTQLFEPSAWLQRDPAAEEKMLRDADIAFSVGYRKNLIAGVTWSLVPKIAGDAGSELASAVCDGLLSEIRGFTSARALLAGAFFSGARFATIHGTTKTLKLGDGKPRKWWVPRRLADHDKRRFRAVPQFDRDELVGYTWEKWHVGNREWIPLAGDELRRTIKHVYQDDEGQLGYGRPLREALGWWWYAKTQVFSESLQAVERFAQGIIKARVNGLKDAGTGLPNDEVMDAWQDVLEDMRARNILVHDAGDEVDFIAPSGEGWQLLEAMRRELRTTIATLVLGSNLPTTADSGGSYALADVQENSTEALIQFDRESLEETLTDQLIGYVWHRNSANMLELGIADIPPRFSLAQQKRLDPQERASVAQILNAMGVALAAEDVYEQTGFRKPDQGEDIIKGQVAPDPAAFPQLGGLA